jgi:hypothetical protein
VTDVPHNRSGTAVPRGRELTLPIPEGKRLATQLRCPSCGNEHYAVFVAIISAGHGGCEFCDRKPAVMTIDEYGEAMRVLEASSAYDFETPDIGGFSQGGQTDAQRPADKRPEPGE